MIPFAEHWRLSLAEAQHLQHAIMGYLPGLRDAAHRLRRAVRRQALGAPGRRRTTASAASPTGRKNYRTSIEGDDAEALSREYVYYDPIYTLPEAGQQWWHESVDHEAVIAEATEQAATSRAAAESQLVL